MTIIFDVLLMGIWIYMVWMVRRYKSSLFYDPRRYKILKVLLSVAGISEAAFITSLIVQATIFGWPEEPVVFHIVLEMLFYAGTIVSMVIFVFGRRRIT